MLLMLSLNLDYNMNNKKIHQYISEVRLLLDRIESELSDPMSHTLENVNHQDVVWYYEHNDEITGEYIFDKS